ncbi:MAG: hypothetical protein M3068_03225 [Gemmatimonadota bacterium]|nr:hypothetical protein [Gemmatimonadota bacterium]
MGSGRAVGSAALALSAACSGVTDSRPTLDFGVITLEAAGEGQAYTTRPVAVFYRTSGVQLPTSTISQDSCAILPFTASPIVSRDTLVYVSAGDSIGVTVGAASGQLKPASQNGVQSYVLPGLGGVSYSPGAVAMFSVPGSPGGFPAATISIRTSEAFSLGSITAAPAVGQGIPVTWTPAGDATSKLQLSLEYATVGSARLDQQIACALVDDGSAVIPAALVGGWRDAGGGLRHVDASRIRIVHRDLGSAQLLVISSFGVAR